MWPKALAEVSYDDIENLLQSRTSEHRHLEFKRDPPGTGDADMQKFLLTIAAFANMGGGYVVYGIGEKNDDTGQTGTASSINPITVDVNKLILRLEGSIRANIFPRVYIGLQPIQVPTDLSSSVSSTGYVLVARIPSSLSIPHGVRVNEGFKFPVRLSGGNSYMDMHEIRSAIVQSDNASHRIDRYIRQRYERYRHNVYSSGISVLQILPQNREENRDIIAGFIRRGKKPNFYPLWSDGWESRYNVDGYLISSSLDSESGKPQSQTQVFRDGKIESVTRGWAKDNILFEERLVEQVIRYIRKYVEELETEMDPFPLVVSLALNLHPETIIVIQGGKDSKAVGEWDLILPHILVMERPDSWENELRPMFDVLWNAFGLERCQYYDKDGKWDGDTHFVNP